MTNLLLLYLVLGAVAANTILSMLVILEFVRQRSLSMDYLGRDSELQLIGCAVCFPHLYSFFFVFAAGNNGTEKRALSYALSTPAMIVTCLTLAFAICNSIENLSILHSILTISILALGSVYSAISLVMFFFSLGRKVPDLEMQR